MEAAAQKVKDQAELNELLHWAAARGLLADAEELVARGAELGARDKQGYCAAHYAAAHGHLDILQFLAAKGADLEAEDGQARLPLHHAAASAGSSAAPTSLEALQYLAKATTWLSVPDAGDNTALHLAARHGWVPGIKLLLASGAESDAPNKRGLSPLGEAVAGGHVEAAQALLAAGASATRRADGYTLLHVAAGLGRTAALQLLLDQPGCTPEWVNDARNSDRATALHAAAMAGALPAAELLLASGADASLAGAGGLQAWQLVPLDQAAQQQRQQDEGGSSSSGSGRRQAVPQAGDAKQQADKLQRLLREAAGAWGAAAGRAAAAQGAAAAALAAAAAGGAGGGGAHQVGPVEAYSQRFRALGAAEQGRKVDALARLPLAELSKADYLSASAKAAVAQVRRAHQLLGVYAAVAALRADEEFQEDAADPGVQAALTDMGLHNNMEKYAAQRQVVSVANKLKKFHTVLQECGGIKLGLPDLLIPPGQTLPQLAAKDAVQMEQLTHAAGEARAAAAAAIAGQQPGQRGRSAGAAAAVAAAGGCEIEPADGGSSGGAAAEVDAGAGSAGGDTDLDRELQQHRSRQAGGGAKPGRVDPDSMPVRQRIVYELVESFKRAVKIMLMMGAIWGVMWWLGLLPHQQDPELLEAHMRKVMAQQQGGQQGAAEPVLPHGGEL